MRIALVSPYDPFPPDRDAYVGGVERVFSELATHLDRLGHDVTVVCSSDPSETRQGREPDSLDVVRVARRGTIMRAPVASLAKYLPRDAQVVHVAATYPFTTPAVIRTARRQRTPCVLDFHFEPDPVTPVGRAAAAAYRMVGPPAYADAQTVLVRSMAYAQVASSLSHVPRERLRVVPNGIDPERFRPDGRSGTDGYLLFIGRLVPYKGLHVLLRALAKVPEAPPLVIAGDGPLRAELEAQARRLGVDVRFAGAVRDEDLPRLYRGARLTVLPSVGKQECFGIALIESMACGTPVLASALPGVQDIARRGGLTFTPGDADDLAQTLRRALSEPPGRGAPLAEATHRDFAWRNVARLVQDVYEETLAIHGAIARPRPKACASSL